MRKEVSYSDINSFLVLVEEGSFTRAAEKLMCSRSQVSKQLSQLESSLGISLLVRTTRTQHLTPAGEAFFERCKQAYAGIDQAISRAIESATELSGEIKINCVGGYIGENIIGPLVADFMRIHPDINIVLDFSSKRVDLVSGEFDFVFRMGELADSALIARRLAELTMGTYASPDYICKYGKPDTPKDLDNHKCITGSMRSWAFVHAHDRSEQEISVHGDLECKNGRIMVYSALHGNGIIRVPEIYCLKELREGKLVSVFEHWHPKRIPLYLVYLQDKHQPTRISAFKDFVLNNFASYLA